LSLADAADGSSGIGAAKVPLVAAGAMLSGGFGGVVTSIAGPRGGSAAVVPGGSEDGEGVAGATGFSGIAASLGSTVGRSGGEGSVVGLGNAAVAGSGNGGTADLAGGVTTAGFAGKDTGIGAGFSGTETGGAAGAAITSVGAGSLDLK
jgi:hypothetical protein